tara:strand:+ start:1162 stop:2070 length:909 start_codon:yes stop_codon:yes gene_type:complete
MNNIEDLTVVIVTFKTNKEILYNCINSIDPNVKILLVENSDNLDFKKEIESKFTNVSVLLANKNLGYGAGNNLGFKNIKTRYGLVSNPDIIFDKNFFKKIEHYLTSKINYSLIGVSYFDDEINTPYGGIDNKNDNLLKKKPYDENFLKEVGWVVGCCILIDTNQVDVNNMFDENIFLYFEEVDLCRRVNENGGKVYNSSILKVKHLGHQGSAATDPNYSIETEMFRSWHWMWSSFYYHKKHNSYFYAIFLMIGKFFKSFLKTIFFSIIYNKKKQTMYFARCYGLLFAFLGKKSTYRVKSLFK